MPELVPFFAILLAGYLAARLRYLPSGVFDGLAQYVFTIAVPVFVFRTMTRSTLIDTSAGNLAELVVLYLLGAAVAMALAIVLGRFALGTRGHEQTRMGIAGSYSNVVLLGIPAATLILNTKAITAMTFLVGVHGLIMALLLVGAWFAQGGNNVDLGKVAVEQAKSPILLALILGFVLNKLGIKASGSADVALRTVALTAVPCALFAYGGLLARYKLNFAGSAMTQEVAAAAVKLIAHPFIFWLLAVQMKVLVIPSSWIWMAVVMAAMPAAYELHAKGKRVGGDVADSTILFMSLAAIVSVSVIVYLVR